RMKMPIDGQRKFTGQIKSLTNGAVVLEMENKTVSLAIDMIDKANLVPEF
ncbi:MAG TPA: ribosome maturation factor RimP, partial [Gammaproteobacteria bacterium]|nr:ribosome maturation factor RimP [Gammaproteobacteria bacterium]